MDAPAADAQPALVARYEDAKIAAAALGFELAVTRRLQHHFALSENDTTVRTFTDMSHLEAFLQAAEQVRNNPRPRRRRKTVA